MATQKKPSIKKKPAKVIRFTKKTPAFRSFKLSKDSDKFVTFKLTKQTLYWTILLVYILFLDVWIANSQMSAIMLLT